MKISIGSPVEDPSESDGEGKNPKSYDKYQLDDAVNTLSKAESIKNNAHFMKHVQKHAAKKVKEFSSIADLKNAYKNMSDDEKKEGE
jgi:hypothetical protein